MAHAIEVAGVEQGYAGVQRRVNGRDTLSAVSRTVHAGHAHAAQSKDGDVRAFAKLAMFHCSYS